MRYLLSYLFLFAAFCLSSCGFQLRGSQPLNPLFQEIYIKTEDPYGQLTRNLREYLKMSGAHVTDTPGEAPTVLNILSETKTQALLSVSSNQQTRQYNLILTVTYEITNAKGVVLVPPQTAIETRAFTTVSDQILGGTNEQNTMYQQMQQAIVYDMMNRLGSRDIAIMLNTHRKNL
jgi:LPS-assembly lipoprotein